MSVSRLPGFYDLSRSDRLAALAQAAGLDGETTAALSGEAGLSPDQADHMIENVVGVYGLPLGVAANFIVNGREVLVPMVIEEPSVVAGASFMARLARAGGGFHAETTSPEMIAQLQVLDVPDPERARRDLIAAKAAILAAADEVDPILRQLGGGARDLEVRLLPQTAVGPMLIVHLIYDTRDAMGANAANTAAERLAPRLESITGGRVHLRILSNLADRRLARASCRIPAASLAFGDFSGERVRDGIVEAWAFAEADPYRAATHNKGIMNGVDAVVIATGNDWRAIEAGAHAYAARSGRYTSLSRWTVGQDGALEGHLEMPMAVGSVGGATRVHPAARACLRLLGVQSARELAEIVVSVGLAQNLAALRALATEGIQRGHMGLHARQVAIAAGAQGAQVEQVARRLVEEGTVRLDRAQAFLQEGRGEAEPPAREGDV
ncbi:MAG TPA: hydroxymethylglutaryl-CoA reductase, degradative [Anaerolineales bacterium]|nr:hydroxymethylglutaryl-CoA reductase, degradative [Anaerolineales bacterium]